MRHPAKKVFIAALSVFLAAYLLAPAIAAACEAGDRRGPKIYPQWLHEAIYRAAWECTTHAEPGKPRVGLNPPERPWFYGVKPLPV